MVFQHLAARLFILVQAFDSTAFPRLLSGLIPSIFYALWRTKNSALLIGKLRQFPEPSERPDNLTAVRPTDPHVPRTATRTPAADHHHGLAAFQVGAAGDPAHDVAPSSARRAVSAIESIPITRSARGPANSAITSSAVRSRSMPPFGA